MNKYLVNLEQDGSFPDTHDKVYCLNSNDYLTIVLNSVKFLKFTPLLLTNYPSMNPHKNSYQHPKAPEITQFTTNELKKEDLQKQYKVFSGFFNTEGQWQVDLHIQDFDGSLYLQVIFLEDRFEDKKENIKLASFGKPEWIMVQPISTMDSSLLKIDELIIQTVLPYSLGPSSKWLEILKNQTQLGYNGFHFPPIQQLGYSGSYYSINDQLKSNSTLFEDNGSFDQIKQIIQDLQKQTKAVCFVDILLNHTSFDSEWLLECPDAVYSNLNTPCLCSAIELDEAIAQFSDALSRKEVKEYYNGSNRIENEDQLNAVMEIMKERIFYGLKLVEFFLFDNEVIIKQLRDTLNRHNIQIFQKEIEVDEDENIFARSGFDIINNYIQQNVFNIGAKRFGVSVDFEKLIIENIKEKPQQYCIQAFVRSIDLWNNQWREKISSYIEQAISSTYGQIRYWHIELQKHQVTLNYTLVPRYFTKLKNGTFAANNGWIQDYDPLKIFTDDGEYHYLRRTINIWGDLVKLRYGNSKKDSPGLWKRMKQYVQLMARIFHGFRLDNAHSTALNVGEYFMRKARNQNKNLMIFAELFTGNVTKDAIFCKKIGINALVRETNHNKSSLDIFGQFCYLSRVSKYGVGSLDKLIQINLQNGEKKEILVPTQPKSIVYDQTHDNQSILSQFSLQQTLSLIALTSFCPFIKGTVRGFDELYPEKLSVVDERRKYLAQLDCTEVHLKDSPIEVILTLKLHSLTENAEVRGDWDNWADGVKMNLLSSNECNYIYFAKVLVSQCDKVYEYKYNINGEWHVDQNKEIRNGNNFFQTGGKANTLSYSDNLCVARREFIKYNNVLCDQYPFTFLSHHAYGFVCIMRENQTKDSFYFLISRTAYNENDHKVDVEIECPGIIENIEAIFQMNEFVEGHQSANCQKNQEFLQGLKTKVFQEFNILKYAEIRFCSLRKKSVLHFFNAPPSLSVVIKCTLDKSQKQAIQSLNKLLDEENQKQAFKLFQDLSSSEINFLLFSCQSEERETTGFGMYHIANQGDLLFGGLAAIFHEVDQALIYNDLGKNLFHNLREGYWYLDYIINRLVKQAGNLTKVANYFKQYFDLLKTIPKYLIPTYFCKFINTFKSHIHAKIQHRMKENKVKLNSRFHSDLLLASYQFLAEIPSSSFQNYKISMSAGLPHFTTGWTRCWGRDTFISFRGLLLISGLYEDAKSIICMFGSTLRHGLIPNLLDGGKSPRYNCRDGCWWWIKAVKDYVEFTNDTAFLKQEINMQFLSDDMLEDQKLKAEHKTKKMTIQDIIQEIFTKHAQGIKFREWRAGCEIDSNMETEGFNIALKMEETNGFIFGGNMKNCLTWMDKMGSSVKAGNKGVPGTSRDGAPVEMTALLKCCLNFLINCKDYPYAYVQISKDRKITFVEWAQLIQLNFEKFYWIPEENINPLHEKYILRKGIYMDTYKSHNIRCDYLLRPNACIAIAVAPELFDLKHAEHYLDIVEKNLLEQNSIGIKTLDPLAPEYVPYYDNADDTVQPKTAHGFSYHNGPEWVWLYGYFVKAILEVRKKQNGFTKQKLMGHLANHKRHIQTSPWLSLPELTNQNGSYCPFSCQSQAWSIATLIEVCFDSEQLQNN
ncbi:hypothetical protein IMG5_154030 [Ichthyophthirius multifiliis]|uniref:4-alpha-glucanotransferase n=1 Tax=Ichthyophthirius multifiliis TaxID=5932 RepID=G0QZ29_ICHMU|nr:hypothetical protein IMG5_154030 [Ichthyophthirius multifiliis]EGR29515.1 hypothetical protein IMG5_154030 [Ichthyophthirius multifiliis]|eukprot:XP_004030751.1 hypothetical protein IMG5_154030 [Ichthyophthirius multifiliis]